MRIAGGLRVLNSASTARWQIFVRSPVVGIDRADLSEGLVNDEITMLCDVNAQGDSKLVSSARAVWAEIYGSAQSTATRATRLDAGKRRSMGIVKIPFHVLSFVCSLMGCF